MSGLWKGENVNEVEEDEKKMTEEDKQHRFHLTIKFFMDRDYQKSGNGGGGILAGTDFVLPVKYARFFFVYCNP